MPVALRIVTDVSYVMRIHHDIVAGAAFGKFMCHFSWQAQHLEKVMCHFSWQAQHVVKFGMIAGAGNVVIFNRICSWRVRKVACVGGLRFAFSGSDHGRIVLGSVAHWKWHCSCFP